LRCLRPRRPGMARTTRRELRKVPEQPGVMEERGRVLAVVAGQEADPVQGVEVAGVVGADMGSCAIHQRPPVVRVPREWPGAWGSARFLRWASPHAKVAGRSWESAPRDVRSWA